MKTELLEISSSGRKADREEVAAVEADAKTRRRWAIDFVVAERTRGFPRAAAWLDGVRLKPSKAEIAEALEPYRRAAAKADGHADTVSTETPVKGPRKRPRKRSLRARRRALRR